MDSLPAILQQAMGALLVILVFVFPLALPFVTVGAVAMMLFKGAKDPRSFGKRAAVGLPLLIGACAPGITSNGAGSFILPWWMLGGFGGVVYHVWAYAIGCVLCVGVVGFLMALLSEE